MSQSSRLSRAPDLGSIPAELFRRQPVLAGLGLVLWALLAPVLVAVATDPRLVDGVETWIKPAKFLAAVGLYALSCAWMFGYVAPEARRGPTARVIVLVIAAASVLELGYILLQASRAERSHFNSADPVHLALYALMGIGAVSLVGMTLPLAWLVARRPTPLRPAFRDAVVLGLVLTFVLGGGFGGLMSAHMSHAVGPEDPGRTLPLFGWSRVGGDLRPAHFLGIHAQQMLPLLACLIPGRGAGARAAVWLVSGLYAALAIAVLLQALAGRPLLGG